MAFARCFFRRICPFLSAPILALFLMAAVTATVVFGVSCASFSERERVEHIAIGALFPLTGEYCDEGIRALNGALMARNEINKAGGILGKGLDVFALNDKNDVEYIVRQYEALKERGVVAIVGSSFSGTTIALARAAEADGIPIISPTASNPLLTEGRKNVFRVIFLDDHQAKIMASYARGRFDAGRALVIDAGGDYAHMVETFSEAFKSLGGTVTAVERVSEENGFRRIFERHRRNPPDVVYCPTDYITAARLAEAAREAGLDGARLLGSDTWDGVLSFLHDPAAMENLYYTSAFASDYDDPKVTSFSQRYFDKYSQPPLDNSALAYTAVQILAAAIEKAGGTDAGDIINAMRTNEIDALVGRIKYDENNNPRPDVYIIQIKNGAYATVEKLSGEGGGGL